MKIGGGWLLTITEVLTRAGRPPDKHHLNTTMVALQKVGKLPIKGWQDITAKICHKVELSLVPPLPDNT